MAARSFLSRGALSLSLLSKARPHPTVAFSTSVYKAKARRLEKKPIHWDKLGYRKPDDKELETLSASLGVEFSSPDVLRQALTHVSCARDLPTNERFGHLGDQVLKQFVVEDIFEKNPTHTRPELEEYLKRYTNDDAVLAMARRFALQTVAIRELTDPENRNRNNATRRAFVSIIGAIYHEKGAKTAKKFVQQHVLLHEADKAPTPVADEHIPEKKST